MTRRALLGQVGAAAIMIGWAVAPAWAQSADTTARQAPSTASSIDDEIDQEILVTAKGRIERIDNVSLSVATIGSKLLKEQQIRDLRDLASYVPSLTLEASRGRASPSTFAIRGLAPNTINKQIQSVSVFLDGVFLGGSASVLDFPDLEAVEVARGPQATEFGRQTYAGAIAYRTRQRTPDRPEARFDGFLSQNQGGERVNGELSAGLYFPVVPNNVWASAFGRYRRLGAMANRTNALRTIKVGEEKTYTFSGSLLVKPHDGFSLKLFGMHQRERDSAPLFTTVQIQEFQASDTQVATIPVPGLNSILFPVGPLKNKVVAEQVGCESAAGRPVDCGLVRNQTFLSAVANIDVVDEHVLTIRGGWQQERSFNNQDLYYRQSPDPTFGTLPYSRYVAPAGAAPATTSPLKAANPFFSATSDRYKVHNIEARIVSPGGRPLRYKAGVYYYKETLSTFSVANITATNPAGRSRGDESVRNVAVFGDVAYDLGIFTAQVEARYDIDRNRFDACTICALGTAGSGAFNATPLSRTAKEFLPRVTLSARPMEGALLYALYSEGTKPGRWNQTIRTNFLFVEPENNKNYEAGFKLRFAEERAFLSGSVFRMNVTGQQFAVVTALPGVGTTTLFQNIGKSRVKGFELEGNYRIASSLRVRGGVAYAKQEYRTPLVPDDVNIQRLFAGSTFVGKTSIGVPRWTATAGADYETALSDILDLRLGVNANYTGKRFADQANLSQLDDLIRVNLTAGLDRGPFSLNVFVRDVFDNNKPSQAAVSATNSCLYLGAARGIPVGPAEQRCLAVGIDRGREIGLSATIRIE